MSERIAIEANDWHAEVCPDAGANFACVRYRGQDLLRPWSEQETNPFLAGAPLLLPANRTAGGRFSFAGKEYVLPMNEPFSGAHLHGELHRQRFQVCAQERDRVELEYENARTVYPFPFRIRIAYRVGVQGLVSEYHIENLASTDMPLTFALHTTFVEPDWFQVPLKADGAHSPAYGPAAHILLGLAVPREEHYWILSKRWRYGPNWRASHIPGFRLRPLGAVQWWWYCGLSMCGTAARRS